MEMVLGQQDLNKAIQMAVMAHADQADKLGKPYILHPLYVMTMMDTIESMIVAILHDVREDTWLSEDEPIRMMFGDMVADAVAVLTRGKNQDYDDYIRRIRKNRLAEQVKRGDLHHNLSEERLRQLPEEVRIRLRKKYARAFAILNGKETDGK